METQEVWTNPRIDRRAARGNDVDTDTRYFRIGEVSRRSGASTDVLRAWERRYGLLRPARSPKGYRLYSADDLRRAQEMQAHLATGAAPAEAAELVRTGGLGRDTSLAAANAPGLLPRLRFALSAYDGVDASRVLDRCLLNLGLAQAIQLVVLPCFRELDKRWECGEISVAQEHFSTNLVRRRLLSVGEGWEGEGDRLALLACAPGEQHDLGLVCFGLALHSYHGWRIKYLGADTPLPDLAAAAATVEPALLVVAAMTPAPFFRDLSRWTQLSGEVTLAIGGPGAGAALAKKIGARFLSGDPVVAAARATKIA